MKKMQVKVQFNGVDKSHHDGLIIYSKEELLNLKFEQAVKFNDSDSFTTGSIFTYNDVNYKIKNIKVVVYQETIKPDIIGANSYITLGTAIPYNILLVCDVEEI